MPENSGVMDIEKTIGKNQLRPSSFPQSVAQPRLQRRLTAAAGPSGRRYRGRPAEPGSRSTGCAETIPRKRDPQGA